MSKLLTHNYSDEVVEAISAMLFNQPFFSAILMDKMKVIEVQPDKNGCSITIMGSQVPITTAATDGKHVWINIDFFKGKTIKERVFIIAHEVCHAIFLHCPRAKYYLDLGVGPDMKPFNHKKWNWAGDYVINQALIDAQVGECPPEALLQDNVKGTDLIDDVYRAIVDPPEDDSDGGGGGFDKHLPADEPLDETAQADMERAIQQAKNAAKAMGKLPASLGNIIDEITNPRVPWETILRQEVSMHLSRTENNWNKPNRRRLAMEPALVMPSTVGHSSGLVVAQIDTSGSISKEEAIQFLSEVKSICEDTCPEKLYVLWVDAEVAHVDDLDSPLEIAHVIERVKKEGAPGGGGTDMTVGFEYLREWGIVPHSMVVLTDGYTPFGDKREYPVIWAISTDIEAPWGQTVKVDMNL